MCKLGVYPRLCRLPKLSQGFRQAFLLKQSRKCTRLLSWVVFSLLVLGDGWFIRGLLFLINLFASLGNQRFLQSPVFSQRRYVSWLFSCTKNHPRAKTILRNSGTC